MFIEKHTDTINGEKIPLIFLKSLNVQAFPCGRRRSTVLSDGYSRIPFDPEARLNTESNSLKHSGANGFTKTYIESWDEVYNQLTVSLAGYMFNIDLESDYVTPVKFGNSLATVSGSNISDNIYLNILIEDTSLFSGKPRAYNTSILSSLAASDDESALDLLAADKLEKSSSEDDYYFSGLAFSPAPLTSAVRKVYSKDIGFRTRDDFSFIDTSVGLRKRVVSLHLLEKVDGTWKIHEPAYLPQIEHGTEENSVYISNLEVNKLSLEEADITKAEIDEAILDNATVLSKLTVHNSNNSAEIDTDVIKSKSASIANIDAQQVTVKGKAVPTIELVESGGYYQLQFSLNSTIE